MCEQRLFDRDYLFPVAIGVGKGPQFNIGLNLAGGEVYHCLVKVMLERSSVSVTDMIIKSSSAHRAPEVINDKCSPVDACRRLSKSFRREVRSKFDLGRLEERDNFEVAVNSMGPASSDQGRALGDFLGSEGPKRMGLGLGRIGAALRDICIHSTGHTNFLDAWPRTSAVCKGIEVLGGGHYCEWCSDMTSY